VTRLLELEQRRVERAVVWPMRHPLGG
jgi:hypothetical protein